MSFRLSDDEIPDEPLKNKKFLTHCYRDRNMSPRTVAYELGVSKSHVTVHMERMGILRPWRHEPTLRRLHVEEGLSPEAISARDEFNVTPTTVEKWLARHDLIDAEPDEISYGRLDELGSESPTPTV